MTTDAAVGSGAVRETECVEVFTEVPVLPVVVPLAVVTIAVLLFRLRRRGLLSAPRAAVALALGVYVAGVVANTVFPIYRDKPRLERPWTDHIDVTFLSGYEVADAVMNVVVFVPLGMLVALLLPRWRWWWSLAAAAGFSAAIEFTQWVTAHLLGGGHIADVNDLTFNVVGAALGLGLLAGASRIPVTGRLIDRFRWAEPVAVGGGTPARGDAGVVQ